MRILPISLVVGLAACTDTGPKSVGDAAINTVDERGGVNGGNGNGGNGNGNNGGNGNTNDTGDTDSLDGWQPNAIGRISVFFAIDANAELVASELLPAEVFYAPYFVMDVLKGTRDNQGTLVVEKACTAVWALVGNAPYGQPTNAFNTWADDSTLQGGVEFTSANARYAAPRDENGNPCGADLSRFDNLETWVFGTNGNGSIRVAVSKVLNSGQLDIEDRLADEPEFPPAGRYMGAKVDMPFFGTQDVDDRFITMVGATDEDDSWNLSSPTWLSKASLSLNDDLAKGAYTVVSPYIYNLD